ncbi:S24/S26 family peptidase [Glycomyces terrestris]|uniref:S26 family signal peptidase n=1 Tax=Glycomyces terrestris TaxID=2493553 RepID=A0A426V0G2_9ACTN|nr:S24/S26 family peptidase [Glycomyces terrestris]RRS00354.1 S26 family signal peptidase [Glycomyces terrestris]
MDSSSWLYPLLLVAAAALMAESVRQLRRRWLLVTVEGDSMEPALKDGDEVLAKRTRRIAAGDVVVAAAPDPRLGWAEARRAKAPWWVKRVAAGPGEPMPGSGDPVPPGHYFLLSDNPAGSDSRRHGPCPEKMIFGTMVRGF